MNRTAQTAVGISTRVSGWLLAAAAFAVAIVVLLVCYWGTVLSLVGVWAHDGTYQYAFLIPPLSIWTAFNLRHQVRANAPVPSVWGLAAVAALVFVWYAGHLLDVNVVQHFALVALFPALVLACWGWRALWVLAFPLGYLVLFAVPWGDGLVGPLQDITARFAVRALELTGTPVLLNGREIVTPAAVWMVADACSGVKFFIACSALGVLYAYLMYQRWRKRVLFVVMAAVVPIIANGLRVYFTILIGDTWGMKYATGMDHLIFGWQFFGSVLVLLLLIGWFFRDPLVVVESPPVNNHGPTGARLMLWPAVITLLIAGSVWAAGVASPVPVEQMHMTAPAVGGWTGPQPAGDDWQPVFHGAAGQVKVVYRSPAGGAAVALFHALYTGKPRRGHTLITYGNDLYDPAQARILSTANRQLKLGDGRNLVAGELRVTGASGERLVWYWYCVDGRCTNSRLLTKFLQAWDVLRGHLPRSSVWALSTAVGYGGADEARANLREFAHLLTVTGTAASRVHREQVSSGNAP